MSVSPSNLESSGSRAHEVDDLIASAHGLSLEPRPAAQEIVDRPVGIIWGCGRGRDGPLDGPGQARWRRGGRSSEHDTRSDRYARFLIEELVPMVEREHGVTPASFRF